MNPLDRPNPAFGHTDMPACRNVTPACRHGRTGRRGFGLAARSALAKQGALPLRAAIQFFGNSSLPTRHVSMFSEIKTGKGLAEPVKRIHRQQPFVNSRQGSFAKQRKPLKKVIDDLPVEKSCLMNP